MTKEDIVNYARSGSPARRRTSGRTRADDAHARAHRRTPDAVEEFHRDAHVLQRGQPRQGHGDAQGTGRVVREGQRHQARLHELLRQGRRQRAATAPGRQCLGRRQRRDLPRLCRHLDCGVDRQRPGDPGAAQRRAHGLCRHREGHRRLCQGGARRQARAGRPAGRHLHHHQRRHVRLADVDADRQPAAERDPGHACDQGARDRRERPGHRRADDVHRAVATTTASSTARTRCCSWSTSRTSSRIRTGCCWGCDRLVPSPACGRGLGARGAASSRAARPHPALRATFARSGGRSKHQGIRSNDRTANLRCRRHRRRPRRLPRRDPRRAAGAEDRLHRRRARQGRQAGARRHLPARGLHSVQGAARQLAPVPQPQHLFGGARHQRRERRRSTSAR